MKKRLKLGPAALVAAAFVGPGTVTACAKAGISFGYSLLWALLISIIITILFQEMAARIGIVTQKGLASVIREAVPSPLLKGFLTLLMLSAILIGNTAYEAGNLNGAVLGLQALFGEGYSSAFPWVVGAIALLLLVIGTLKNIQNLLIGLVLVMSVSFLLTAMLTGPPIFDLIKGLFVPNPTGDNLFTILALLGTTVVPYNLFLHASMAANEWKSTSDLPAARWDTILAVGLGGLVSMAIVVTAAALPISSLESVLDLAAGLEPLFGSYARWLIGLGLFAAGLTSALTAPLAAAFVVVHCLGWKDTPASWRFKGVAIFVLLLGTLSLGTSFKPIQIILFAQAANGALLPILAFLLVWIANKKSVLGLHKNSKLQNALGWLVILLSLLLSIKTLQSFF